MAPRGPRLCLLRYRTSLGKFFEDIGEFSINAFGIQATVKRKAKEATEALQAAAISKAMASVPAGSNARSLNPPCGGERHIGGQRRAGDHATGAPEGRRSDRPLG